MVFLVNRSSPSSPASQRLPASPRAPTVQHRLDQKPRPSSSRRTSTPTQSHPSSSRPSQFNPARHPRINNPSRTSRKPQRTRTCSPSRRRTRNGALPAASSAETEKENRSNAARRSCSHDSSARTLESQGTRLLRFSGKSLDRCTVNQLRALCSSNVHASESLALVSYHQQRIMLQNLSHRPIFNTRPIQPSTPQPLNHSLTSHSTLTANSQPGSARTSPTH